MGLSLSVGIFGDLEGDPEGIAHHEEIFRALEPQLLRAGLRPHVEPRGVAADSWDMFGYGSLHCLRRLAAHLDAGRDLPEPAAYESASQDPLVGLYSTLAAKSRPGLFARLFGRTHRHARGFDHLMLHSDAEGYYLPQDFADVLFTEALSTEALSIGDGIPGGMVGSAPRLLAECDRLAAALGIPGEIESESEELVAAIDDPDGSHIGWQRYGYESHSCVTLREACRASVATGCALVFC